MFQEKTRVLWNREAGPNYYRLGLTCHSGYSGARPGQFVMLGFDDRLAPLLRRPFSIHRRIIEDGQIKGIELLYKVVGVTTENMSMLKLGDSLSLLGPLGRGFVISNDYRRVFFVAGGIGVAPMLFLALSLAENGFDLSGSVVFLGGASKHDLLCREDFLRFGMTVHVTTDDGSAGDQCLVTLPLESRVQQSRPDVIYACGPIGMLRCVVNLAREHDIPCQVSIETLMACGMGACLGCAVKGDEASEGYLHACMDGPVFDIKNLSLS
jgi:dihydroorotate dehydrogenase electron transfer subunit